MIPRPLALLDAIFAHIEAIPAFIAHSVAILIHGHYAEDCAVEEFYIYSIAYLHFVSPMP
jgi:hypothetical protein